MNEQVWISNSRESSRQLARQLTTLMLANSNIRYVLLTGGLGAGKTTLVQDILAYLGSTDIVTSPTFSICNTYKARGGGMRVLHSDLYRVESITELEQTGFFELAESCDLALIEWGDKLDLATTLPSYISININVTENERHYSYKQNE
ncbi:hypothetical protein RsTz2092_14070 [Deferribacterales bacterium RsTz2092]|nr:hypothetical protein AGMMS49941_10110 [Deferribacterales bacterium]